MSDTIRVWTLGAKLGARLRATAPAGRSRRPRDLVNEPPHPSARLPQRLAVSGEIGAELCSAAASRAKNRR